MIQNPILPGFNPDPSIIAVGDDFYIATSTFEWFPGIPIYHSRDLKNWELISHVLTRKEQVHLIGMDSALGVWAPALSYDQQNHKFYVCISVISNAMNNNFDVDNYVYSADCITGPWSNAYYLNSSGFDPSLFHDVDGRKWVVNLEWDFRKGYEHPGAIVLEELDVDKMTLMGNAVRISRGGTDRGCLEGPQLYKRGNYYYLITAEGGTGYGHAVVVSRSKCLEGPYESFSGNPVITSQPLNFTERGVPDSMKINYYNSESELQKSGHGSLVETTNNGVYMVHLCARPLPGQRCILGRETAIQKCRWTQDDWLVLDSGGNLAQLYVEESGLVAHPSSSIPSMDDFSATSLNLDYYSLREPADSSWLTHQRGQLILRGRESLFSKYNQSLIAKKMMGFHMEGETAMRFEPKNFLEMAGLVCYYNNKNFYYLREYHSESMASKCLGIMVGKDGHKDELLEHRVAIDQSVDLVYLKVRIEASKLQFYYALEQGKWEAIGPVLDASILSDEFAGGFTGTFVGICAQDLYKRRQCAEFKYFRFQQIHS